MSTELELKVGQVYRAKKPTAIGRLVNDRQIIWIGLDTVQYDGPAVGHGRQYPRVKIDAFRKWAARNVTDEMPKDDSWAEWPPVKEAKS